jgi:hypothetical protein
MHAGALNRNLSAAHELHYALRAAAARAPLGYSLIGARKMRWAGEMKFSIALVNPKTNEERTVTMTVPADQISRACKSSDPAFSVMTFAKPVFPRGFMPIGGGACPLRPVLSLVR